MNDDFSIFWRNDVHAQGLFYDLLARSERHAYDDDFLMQLAAYREAAPSSERADIFAAKYLLHHGDIENAATCGERAYAKRPINLEVWRILAAVYEQLGRDTDATAMQGYAYGLYQQQSHLSLHLTEENLQECLDRFSLALGPGNYAPMAPRRAHLDEKGLRFDSDVFIGEPLPRHIAATDAPFWSALYTENEYLSERASMLASTRGSEEFLHAGYKDTVFHLQKAQEFTTPTSIEIHDGKTLIVPIAGTAEEQRLLIQTSQETRPTCLGKWSFSYFRFDEPVTIHTENETPYALGTPIPLGHHPRRRKLVMNILLDGLSWPVVRKYFADAMPNIARFFAEGTIFDQHFSTSEYTYPSLPAINTGRYPHHTHIFNERVSHEIPRSQKSISEQMKSLGYFCGAPITGGDSVYCGAMRGHDQLTINPWNMPAHEGVERTIRLLEAFEECDQFLFFHTTDVHPWNGVDYKFATPVETRLPLSERLFPLEKNGLSVRLPNFPIYQQQFWMELRHLDRSIGQLLSYIMEHYTEDEYIINLYSDHGTSIFSSPPSSGCVDVVSAYSTGAAWMMRGRGVPKGAVVQDLTGAVDIYPTLGHLCGFPVSDDIDGRLPAIFGGTARDAVYSASQYPGQSFKLAVRTHDHAMRIETRGAVDEDGTVNFENAIIGIYPRGHELEEDYALGSEELRAFFYPRARDFVREITNNGEFWPAMRAARPEWFGGQP